MEIRNSFSKRANTYDEQSFIQQDVNKRLLNRLRLIKHSQSNVLEIGSGTGKLSCDILNDYPSVNLISMDLSLEMLKKHKLKNPETNCLVGNAENPPFNYLSFDTILSSLTLHWCNISSDIFFRFYNLLKPNGLLLFSVAGPDTFKEFRKLSNNISQKLRFHPLMDMHYYGDFLLEAHFKDPVVDSEKIVVEFETFDELLKSIRHTGTNITSSLGSQYYGKTEYKALKDSMFNASSNSYELTYEIIYGYALKPDKTIDKSGNLIQIKEVKKE